MSLINDAIKRANQTNKERTPAGATPGESPTAGMQSADGRAKPVPEGSMSGMLIVAGIVVFVLLGGSLLFLSLRGTHLKTDSDGGLTTGNATRSPGATVADTTPAATALPAQDAAASALTNPVPEPVVPAGTPIAGAGPSVTSPPVVVPTGPRPFPELKLQGIYYRLNDPSVMINGKALEIGDLIEDVKVIKIDRKEVTLELDGQLKVLRLQ